MAKPEKPILMGVIGAAHGLRGEVRVKTFTGDPLALAAYGPLHDAAGKAFDIVNIRPAGEMVVVRFEGIQDRNAAERLTGTELFVDRTALPGPGEEEEEEFYHADLIGLTVTDETGAAIGVVTAVQNFGVGDILELAVAGKSALIPFTTAAVPDIDITAKTIRIDSIAAGLAAGADEEGPDGAVGAFGRRPRGPRDAGGNR